MKTREFFLFAATMLSGTSILASENMNFRGTLLEYPPCEINGGQPVEIDFGEMGVNKVDGENYARSFTLTYNCEGASTDKILRYLGSVTEFDPAAVQSNFADFGIRLSHRTPEGVVTPLTVGSTLLIAANNDRSTFVATPVKKSGAVLQEGAFNAGATLQLNYP
ncbi:MULTISPECIES: fimbrial protein [Enterobacter cloacae complex]|uniref:fimbrial protein n=1 Tax=Enterobacter cloacae complex TaxID=354276 RepID=UPI003075F76C